MTRAEVEARILRDIEDRRRRDVTAMLVDGVDPDAIAAFLDAHATAMATARTQLAAQFDAILTAPVRRSRAV